jgi:hypothetical protein
MGEEKKKMIRDFNKKTDLKKKGCSIRFHPFFIITKKTGVDQKKEGAIADWLSR